VADVRGGPSHRPVSAGRPRLTRAHRRARAGPSGRARPQFLGLAACLLLAVVSCASCTSANPAVGATGDLALLTPEARERAVIHLADSGVASVLIPLEWGRVEPQPGRFVWGRDDAAVGAARARGFEVALILGPTAPWAVDPNLGLSPDLACFSVPKSLSSWDRYVRRAATHFRGKVRVWQVRAQPNARNFRGSVEEYFALLAAAARVLRAVDPQNRIIQPESVPFDPAGLDRRLKAPLGGTWDIWGAYLPARADLSPSALALAMMTTEVLAPPSASRPVWVVGAAGDLTADRWVQYYLLAAAFGASRFYAPPDILHPQWAPALSHLRYQGFLRLGPGVWAFAFTDDSGPAVVAWSEQETRLPPSALAPVSDAALLATSAALGGLPGSAGLLAGPAPMLTLGPRPVLLRGLDIRGARAGAPTRADVLAARGTPDLSGLASVSVDYNRPGQPEVGLYNRALRALPGGSVCELPHPDRIAVGTCLRPGPVAPAADVPWVYFDVDDSWLYGARERLRVAVTVEVEAPAAGKEVVGFNLYYDAVDGYRTTPWQWVDGGGGWRTYRVVLEGVSFTNRNGYDFRINAKGSHQDLWVASVKVEKLGAPASAG